MGLYPKVFQEVQGEGSDWNCRQGHAILSDLVGDSRSRQLQNGNWILMGYSVRLCRPLIDVLCLQVESRLSIPFRSDFHDLLKLLI